MLVYQIFAVIFCYIKINYSQLQNKSTFALSSNSNEKVEGAPFTSVTEVWLN